ncbi:MAG TPA: SIS domain-containing protein [Chthoniobacterales bacterium]|nr:SIS domain-containing protein [Chthoniobacterales bacterium]
MTGTVLFERYPALRECEGQLRSALDILITGFQNGNKLLVCGNGGSAADCEHIVGELMKGFQKPRSIPQEHASRLSGWAGALGSELAGKLQGALPAISLVSHSSLMTAVLNDTAGDMVFAQQIYGLGKPGDVLLAISTSGNSANVINALVVAKTFGLRTIVLTGRSGGALAPMAEVAIRVPADRVAEIQELHLPVYHWLSIELEERFFA